MYGRLRKLIDFSSLLSVAVRPLTGGSVLYVLHNETLPLALIQAVVRTGSIHEGEYAGCGVSHFLEHMLFQGCARYPGNSASDRVHELGGECNAYTAFDHTAYYVELPAEKLIDGIDILSSMLSEPAFPEEKFVSEKAVIAREAEMIFDRPEQVLIQNLWQQVFTVHPARFPIVGFPDKIADVSRAVMTDYYGKRYGGMRVHWLIAGAVDPDAAATLLNERLANFSRGNLAEPVMMPEPEQQFERILRAEFADPMARIALGVKTPPAAHRDIPALDALTGIIGQNSSSRLVRKLWQEEELAIAMSASGYAGAFAGVFGVNASCEPAKLAALETGIRRILEDVRQNGVTAAELEREKLQQRTHFYRTLESSRETIAVINDGVLNYGTPDHAGHYLARLEALTLDEVNQAAAEYLKPETFSWSVLAPAKAAVRRTRTAAAPLADPIQSAARLASGAETAVMTRGALPLNDYILLLPAGSVWEGETHNGISALLAEVLSSGPADWSESEFYDLLDNNGIELSVNGGNNTFSVALNYPVNVQPLAEKIFLRLLCNPRWDANVFAREKGNLIEQLCSRMMNPRFAALQAARQAMYGNHPAGLSRLGTPESLQAITLDELRDFYFARFDPAWVKLGATTADKGSAIARCEKFLEKLDARLPWAVKKIARPLKIKFEHDSAERPPLWLELPREQSAVIYAVPGCTADSPDHLAMEILDVALNGLSSRLFKEIRENNSLAYSTGASINFGLVPGMIALHAGTQPARAEEALGRLTAEAVKLADGGLTRAEFEAARLGAVANYARRLEQADAQLVSVLLALFYHEKAENGLNATTRLRKLRYGDFNRAVRRCFAGEPQIAVIAGPSARPVQPAAKRSRGKRTPEQPELPLYKAGEARKNSQIKAKI